MPTMSRACRARSPAICSCSATSGTWCAKASTSQWAGRSARQIVDAPMLQNAVASGSVLRPGQTITAIKAAFRAEKAGALVRLAKDVGRLSEKAGTKGALDTLRIAEGPKDVARAARLAESKAARPARS